MNFYPRSIVHYFDAVRVLPKLQRRYGSPQISIFRIVIELGCYAEPLLSIFELHLIEEDTGHVVSASEVCSVDPQPLLIKVKSLVGVVGNIKFLLESELVLLNKLLVQVFIGGPACLHFVTFAHPVLSALEGILGDLLAVGLFSLQNHVDCDVVRIQLIERWLFKLLLYILNAYAVKIGGVRLFQGRCVS